MGTRQFSFNVFLRILMILALAVSGVCLGAALGGPRAHASAVKMYYTTDDDWSVKRANVDGTGVENLYTSASGTPHGIAFDRSDNKVYFTDNYSAVQKIQRMNLDGTGLEDVMTGVQAVDIALHVGEGKMYYTTDDDWSVKRANLDGTGVENLYTSASGTPHGIAIDYAAGKVYFTDNYSAVQKIQRMNLDGTGLEDVMTGVQAVGIDLDVAGGKMYYTTNDDWSVKRANLDGTGVENLYTSASGTPHGIAIDRDTGKVYFTDNYSSVQKIQRMNLDGTGLEDVLTGVRAVHIALDSDPNVVSLHSFAARGDVSPLVPACVAGLALGLPVLLFIHKRRR